MLDVKNLERRWLKYKFRSYAPHLLGGVFFLMAASYLLYEFTAPRPAQEKASTPAAPAAKLPVAVVQAPAPTVEANTVLEPSMEFLQTFYPSGTAVPETPQPLPKTETPPIAPVATTAVATTPVIAPSPKTPKSTLSIQRNESALDIEEVKQRFAETSNANLGLFIARYYYDHEEYAEAYNYALKTNAINNRIDESWILFSKSLVKLGKTEEAQKTLRLYHQQSGSEDASTLLEAIGKGTFK